MSRYLRFVTTVGDDQPAQWDEEELHVNSEELSSATGQYPTTLTVRERLKQMYCSERFQVQCSDISFLNTSKMLPLYRLERALVRANVKQNRRGLFKNRKVLQKHNKLM